MKLFSLFVCLLACGCAPHRPAAGMAYVIPQACLTAPVELAGCDDNSPPKCKRSIIRFRKGCETLALKPKENPQ